MFSGIIEAVGTVTRAEIENDGLSLTLEVPESHAGLPPGTSLAVNGTCLTVVEASGNTLRFDAVGATLRRTLLGEARPGARVNLERSLRVGSPVDGHIVTGHVDGTATVVGRVPGEGAVYFEFEAPPALAAQIAPRGSVAVDGVSLTVAEAEGVRFTVSIVPYTIDHTIFGDYRPGTRVHLETDVLAKYVERALAGDAARTGPWTSVMEKQS